MKTVCASTQRKAVAGLLQSLFAAALLLAAQNSFSADIIVPLSSFQGVPASVKTVEMYPLNVPQSVGGVVVIGDWRTLKTDSSGSVTFTNVTVPDCYRITFSGQRTVIFTNCFTADDLTNETLNAANFITNSAYTTTISAYSKPQADSRFIPQTNASATGYVLTVTNGVVTALPPPSGSGLGDVTTAQLNAAVTNLVPLDASASITVPTTNNATTNGLNLIAAYARAKSLTPNGSALSSTNRATVLIPPGRYHVTSSNLVMDTDWVDLVGTSSEASSVFISSAGKTIVQLATNSAIKNLTAYTTSPLEDGERWSTNAAYWPKSDLPGVLIENCIFDSINSELTSIGGNSMRSRDVTTESVTYSGRYVKVINKGAFGFGGYHGHATGTFIDCTNTKDTGFGGEGISISSGYFLNCTNGGDFGFAGEGGTASGTFINCTHAGEMGFGGGSGIASGTFVNSRSGEKSFGNGLHGEASGLFQNCVGGSESFGGYLDDPGTMSGTMIGCIISTNPIAANVIPSGTWRSTVTGTVLNSILGGTNVSYGAQSFKGALYIPDATETNSPVTKAQLDAAVIEGGGETVLTSQVFINETTGDFHELKLLTVAGVLVLELQTTPTTVTGIDAINLRSETSGLFHNLKLITVDGALVLEIQTEPEA